MLNHLLIVFLDMILLCAVDTGGGGGGLLTSRDCYSAFVSEVGVTSESTAFVTDSAL